MSFDGDLYPSSASVVMSTKGDMVDFDSQRQRLGIGSTGQVLTVASSLPTWATLTTADSILTTQGDVLYESASGLARLAQSTDGFVLTTKGAGANPVWAAAGGALSTNIRNVTLPASFTTSAGAFVAITGMSITITNSAGGLAACTFNAVTNDAAGYVHSFGIADDGTVQNMSKVYSSTTSNDSIEVSCGLGTSTDGSVMTCQCFVQGGTMQVNQNATYGSSQFIINEVY